MKHWIYHNQPAVVLAPMEGVTDHPMRSLLTGYTYFTHCVSEFLRISQNTLPSRCYLDNMPELATQAKTLSGVPVILQLLGGDADKLAAAATLAVEIGARAIDLNFGCPAPTVNNHDGGATLLKYPDRIFKIVHSVRSSVPKEIPVSAKIRLGWDSIEPVQKNAEMIFKAGASWLTIHARTKTQGYQPPVFWKAIGEVKKVAPIPVIANGDIWTIDDFKQCRDITLCEHFMVGRGVLVNPFLPEQIAKELGLVESCRYKSPSQLEWQKLFHQMASVDEGEASTQRYVLARIKQWLALRNRRIPTPCFDKIKRFQNLSEFLAAAQNTDLFDMDQITY